MGLQKDLASLFKDLNHYMSLLQNLNTKFALNNKVSRSGEGFRNFNTKANIKFNNMYHKMCEWIRNEMKK